MRLMRYLVVAALCLIGSPAYAGALGDVICETTATTGTGTVSLAGALTGGYVTFITQISSGSTVPYRISTGSGASRKIETGVGTFTDATPDTLSRTATWSTDGNGVELTLAGTSTVCLGVNKTMLQAGGYGIVADTASAGDSATSFWSTGTCEVARGCTGQATEAEALGEMTQALTEDTAPDPISDMATVYDASADTGSKVALYNLSGEVVLATGTISSGSSLDLALDTTGYSNFKTFRLIIRNVDFGTDGAEPWLRFSDDGGTTFEADASDYAWTVRHDELATATNSIISGDGADDSITMSNGVGSAVTEFANFDITIENPASSAQRTAVRWNGFMTPTNGAIYGISGTGLLLVAAASTDVRFMPSIGIINSATYTLIGIK